MEKSENITYSFFKKFMIMIIINLIAVFGIIISIIFFKIDYDEEINKLKELNNAPSNETPTNLQESLTKKEIIELINKELASNNYSNIDVVNERNSLNTPNMISSEYLKSDEIKILISNEIEKNKPKVILNDKNIPLKLNERMDLLEQVYTPKLKKLEEKLKKDIHLKY